MINYWNVAYLEFCMLLEKCCTEFFVCLFLFLFLLHLSKLIQRQKVESLSVGNRQIILT